VAENKKCEELLKRNRRNHEQINRCNPLHMSSTRALAAILMVGLVMRLMLLPGWPVSTDVYRYVWDGRVQDSGINPYLHLPADATLAGLRDGAIYPYINRGDYAPTIYPPMSQIVFFLVTRISETELAMKAAMVAFEGLAVWAILQLLAARGLPRSHVLLYAWHPLPLWEFARSGHVDIVAIAMLLAFLAIERRSHILAGVALGAGVLVKYFPVITGPALYKSWDWRLPVAFVATIAVHYLYRRRDESYEVTCEAAMAAFAKSWRWESDSAATIVVAFLQWPSHNNSRVFWLTGGHAGHEGSSDRVYQHTGDLRFGDWAGVCRRQIPALKFLVCAWWNSERTPPGRNLWRAHPLRSGALVSP
jgi:hypothetical protein